MVVSGGLKAPDDYAKVLETAGDPFVIGVDEGALWLLEHGFSIDLAVGDFDTIGEAGLTRLKANGVPTDAFPAAKDATDTELAYFAARDRGAQAIIFYGALGLRFDHSLSNVHILYSCIQDGIDGCIMGPHHRLRLLGPGLYPIASAFPYISLIPFSPVVTGVTLSGFRYPLDRETIRWGAGTGRSLSNELTGEAGQIYIEDGWLIVIESRDG